MFILFAAVSWMSARVHPALSKDQPFDAGNEKILADSRESAALCLVIVSIEKRDTCVPFRIMIA